VNEAHGDLSHRSYFTFNRISYNLSVTDNDVVSGRKIMSKTASTSSPARILIADDNPQGVELLEAYLAASPHETKIATNGEETLKLVREWKPDLILLDVMMPRLSGFEVCKQLREDPTTRDIAVIMVTALDQSRDVDRAVEAGTDDFLTKPINKTELLIRVESLLAGRALPFGLNRTLIYIDHVQQAIR
jgi:DNA-binding response OmpR family regulator